MGDRLTAGTPRSGSLIPETGEILVERNELLDKDVVRKIVDFKRGCR
jgi:hypothetical protein